MKLSVGAATDVGLRREHNEDAFASWAPADDLALARCGTVLVVADGMGGTAAGEVASRLAVDTVVETYRVCDDSPEDALRRALEAAHDVVHRRSLESPAFKGMGTTCTALAVRGREAFLAHVGDSRAYLVHGGTSRQLTTDHSLVAQLVEHRLLTPDEARVDPRRNVLTRSVGVGESVEVDSARLATPLEAGDTLMLCSDGLHGLVEDHELAEAASCADLQQGCDALVQLARARGGHDNITVMLARLS